MFLCPKDTSTDSLSQANTMRDLQETEQAMSLYQAAAAIAPTAIVRLEALANQLVLCQAIFEGECAALRAAHSLTQPGN